MASYSVNVYCVKARLRVNRTNSAVAIPIEVYRVIACTQSDEVVNRIDDVLIGANIVIDGDGCGGLSVDLDLVGTQGRSTRVSRCYAVDSCAGVRGAANRKSRIRIPNDPRGYCARTGLGDELVCLAIG